jgi:hypothetical protein
MATTPIIAVASYSSIQPAIDNGTLKYPSYVLCRDGWTWAFVDKDSTIKRVKGYQQESIIPVDVLPTKDIRTDAFYFCNNIGYLYINNSFVPVFKDLENTTNSYDQLKDVPVINKYGEVTAPLNLMDLDNGSYSVSGQYKIGGDLETIYVTSSKVLFLIDSDEENKYITKLDPKNICTYTINASTLTVIKSNYATDTWVLAQGYATETFVNQAIEDLYNKIASKLLITKVSQLENDAGYLTADNFEGIRSEIIAGLF